jgi:hypothetical protein
MTTSPKAAKLVVVEYEDLTAPADDQNQNGLMEKLEQAFGMDGCGIIGIRNVPSFKEAKQELLPLAYPLAHLPPVELKALEDPDR